MANQKRRDQIAHAALELFDQWGYHGTGMEDIAKSVGLRASSLYNHFRSKQEVLAHIAVGTMEELLRRNAVALAGRGEPREKLLAVVQAHVEFHAEEAMRVRVVNGELSSLEEPTRSVVLQLRRDYVARWMHVVEEGVETGIFSAPDVKIACWSLIDQGIGVSQWFAPDGSYSAQQLGEMYGEFALRQLGAR